VTVPVWIRLTSLRFVVVGSGTRHTLASNLSMQFVPDTTASSGQRVTGPPGGPAAPALPANNTMAAAIRIAILGIGSLLSRTLTVSFVPRATRERVRRMHPFALLA
jgi:hypothetical protein